MNTRIKLGLALFVGIAAVGCSSSSSDDEGPTGPVAASPLKGTIDGKDFVGKIAIARQGFHDGERSVDIYDFDTDCDATNPEYERMVLISLPWEEGMAKDFSFSLSGGDTNQTATFVIDKDGTADNIVATTGRVELVSAPTDKGETGTMRLRASAQGNQVEGEIPVLVCD